MAYQVKQFGSNLYINNELNWVPHAHIHTHVEIVYLTKGSFSAILDNEEYLIEAGDFLIVFPNQIHFYFNETPLEGYIAVFSSDLHKELKSIFHKKTPVNPILHREQLPAGIADSIEKIYENFKADTRFSKVVSDARLLEVLGETLSVMTFKENSGDYDTIKRILLYCMNNYTQPITLEVLSNELCLSPSYISRIFHERMRTSYIEFLNNLRVEHACDLLGKGTNITEIAYASGFSSISTFNRVFAKRMNMAPREYINRSKTTFSSQR